MMRRLHLLALCFLAFGAVSAQVWLEGGLKFTFGPAGYLNANIVNDDQHDYSLGTSFAAGGVLGINIGDYHGINLEGLFGTYYQDLTYRGGAMPATNSLEWGFADLFLLYRFYAPNGFYLELGPKLTQVRFTDQTLDITPIDTEGQYADQYYSGVAGVGAILAGSKIMVAKMGLRVEYGLTDLVSEEGQKEFFPAFYSSYSSTAITRPYRVSLGVEISFGIGGVAQAACGRRTFVLGGRYR